MVVSYYKVLSQSIFKTTKEEQLNKNTFSFISGIENQEKNKESSGYLTQLTTYLIIGSDTSVHFSL